MNISIKIFLIFFTAINQEVVQEVVGSLKSTGETITVNAIYNRFIFAATEVPLEDSYRTENLIQSWCTNARCKISPRTYLQPISLNLTLVGFTDEFNRGHVLVLDDKFYPIEDIWINMNGTPAAVAGLYGFTDGSFAAMLFIDSTKTSERKMWLQFYRSDLSVEWSSLLNSPISVPDRNIGDFRLSYGNGLFLAYFSVYGISNFANGSNGEQISFVNDRGEVKSSSIEIPGQDFVKSGDIWGCSHSLGQLTAYHESEKQFITVCNADNYPDGISVGDLETGFLVFKASVDGRGVSSAGLGQIAQSTNGFKLVFNAENSCETDDCECCPARGVGFITVYNEVNSITGSRDVDDIEWLTSSNGSSERDPVIARMYIGSSLANANERYLVGWHDIYLNDYFLGITNKFGLFLKRPTSTSNVSFSINGSQFCTNHCVSWGNRDDSFKTFLNGNVGWIQASPLSSSIWLYNVAIDGVSPKGWSLWTAWSRCSRSCGGGVASRIRSCLSDDCSHSSNQVETTSCNTDKCKIPITCTFKYNKKSVIQGDLFVNGERVFGYTPISAQEKCIALKDVCRGITEIFSKGVPFYFLKAGSTLQARENTTSALMECKETPGWSTWSTWFACSALCGGGVQVRDRFCDGGTPESHVCPGKKTKDSQVCNTGRCASWSDWSNWIECSTSCDIGIQSRSRRCTGDYPHQCRKLFGDKFQQQSCTKGSCPIWTSWSTWSECSESCGNGLQFRKRACLGDFPCPESELGIADVEKRRCLLKSCFVWSEWQSWSTCRDSCGESMRKRIRQCSGEFSGGDCPLEGEAFQSESCNLGKCPFLGFWSEWSFCSKSCGIGLQIRTRPCLGDFPEKFCEAQGSVSETRDCNLGQCPYLGNWSAWSLCSATCGDGLRSRRRACLGDFPCLNNVSLFQEFVCNLGVCPSWASWSFWGPCSITCGDGGRRKRTRICLGDFPGLCKHEASFDFGPCENLSDCPRWNEWTFWSVCSLSCNVGFQRRFRRCSAAFLETCNSSTDHKLDSMNITVFQSSAGDFVQTESLPCNLGLCSYWLDWVTWNSCSATCDEGFQIRTRKCFGDFPRMCKNAGPEVETRSCLVGKCGTWDQWQPWGPCSRTCGNGTWKRSRKCLGDFLEMCRGAQSETATCDISDCVDVCIPNPCLNKGECRHNEYLTRLYHCVCPPGWMGKHCDRDQSDLLCESDSILISFDRKIVADEGLITNDPGFVSLLSRDSVACTAMFDQYNTTEYYLLVIPSPIDSSCGSYLKVSNNSYEIRNKVIWQAEDKMIRSTVILIDFTCVYKKNVQVSSDVSSTGTLTLDSFSREVKLITAEGTFKIDISLFRDSSFQQMIIPGKKHPFVSLAEGEVVFVSVDLQSRDLIPSNNIVLVMDTCYVTSLQSDPQPLMYLVQNSCPFSPFISILMNGISRSGRFSVRVFGWTGRVKEANHVYIHCAVSVCNTRKDNCIPECDRTVRMKRSPTYENRHYIPKKVKNILEKYRKKKQNGMQNLQNVVKFTSTSSDGHPFVSITKTVPSLDDGRPDLDSASASLSTDSEKLVSFGPFQVILKSNFQQRQAREVQNEKLTTNILKPTRTTELLRLICVLIILVLRFYFKTRFFIR